jgi:hypothetical protein
MPRLIRFSLVLFIVFSVMSILEQTAIASGILKVTEKPNLQAVDKPEDEPASMSKAPITLQSQSAFSDTMEDFLVNDDTTGGRNHFNVDVARDLSGNFVIVWRDPRNGNLDIYAQRYDSSGTAIDSNFRVNDDTGTYDQQLPAVAIDGSGNFVITWEDHRSGYPIYARRYDSSGNPIDSSFRVNEVVNGGYYPDVAMDGSGSFVISWERPYYYGGDIYAQRFDSSGSAIGSNLRVNDDTGAARQSYAIY